MERPWGLSGPEFLELYWIALAVSLAFAILVRVRLRGTRGGDPAGALGLFDLAHLTGGPRRVVETSVAGLIDSGALVPSRGGAVRVVGSVVADDPVDQAVLADAARYRHRTLALLVTSVSEQDAPRAVGRRLVERGHLVAPDVVARWLRLGVVPMAVLLVVGVARWVNGLVVGAPVGWLTLQLVLTAVLIAVALRVPPLTRTASGRDAVARARAGGITGGWGVTGSAGAAEPVALNGLAGHPDVVVREAVRPRSRARAASGGAYAAGSFGVTSGGCGSSGGSGCGGGGGGCGGGGG
ncbi:TIGR04222 domain-containing membrane protein [Actinosynnema sp. NPDC053489]|uniref:TIGR04222 domain-containing membrane protein n=1 Tax=Actinosynnema sp. NPDC053489 TaxID=3363916 RepID=UPI0037C532B9